MYSMIFGCLKYIPAQKTARKMESAPMDIVSVTQDFTVLTAPIRRVLDQCVVMMKTTFSTVLIAVMILQEESKFLVNSMKTSSQVHLKVFAMGSVRVSALLRTLGRTAVYWIVSIIAVSMVTAASSFRNRDACVTTDTQENTASTENASITALTRTEFAIQRREDVIAMLYIPPTPEESSGLHGRAKTAPGFQHGVDEQPSLFCHHLLSFLPLSCTCTQSVVAFETNKHVFSGINP